MTNIERLVSQRLTELTPAEAAVEAVEKIIEARLETNVLELDKQGGEYGRELLKESLRRLSAMKG